MKRVVTYQADRNDELAIGDLEKIVEDAKALGIKSWTPVTVQHDGVKTGRLVKLTLRGVR